VITRHLADKKGGVIPFPLIGYRGMIPGGEMMEMIIEGELATMTSTLNQSDILCQKDRDYSDEGRESNQRKIKGI
jgi:hypothetical protein